MLQRWGGRFFGGGAPEEPEPEPEPFSFAEPLSQWPQGGGFARGSVCVGGGKLKLAAITAFQKICTLSPSARRRGHSATFYRPVGVPAGFSVLGHYCQPSSRPLHGHLLVARAADTARSSPQALLRAPRDYELVWAFHASGSAGESSCAGYGRGKAYFWLPVPPEGYRALGFLVTTEPLKPPLEEVGCVRADLTDECEPHGSLFHQQLARPSSSSSPPGEAFAVRGVRPLHRGMWAKGIGAGTFCCAADGSSPREQGLACLKNVELDLSAMPTLEQVHAVIRHYGPTVLPPERGLPAVVRVLVLQERSRAVQQRGRRRRRGDRRRGVQPPGRRVQRWGVLDRPAGRQEGASRLPRRHRQRGAVRAREAGDGRDVHRRRHVGVLPVQRPGQAEARRTQPPAREDWAARRRLGALHAPRQQLHRRAHGRLLLAAQRRQVGGRVRAGVRRGEQARGVLVQERAR